MYNTDLTNIPTYDELLTKITEYDIYKYYIGNDIKLNFIISSPLRSDKHPSFGIFKSAKTGNLLFKDLSTGISGNCIHFVMNLFNITYFAAIKKVWFDIILNRVHKTTTGIEIDKIKSTSTEILVNKRNWSKTDDDYWSQYGITREYLKRFKVHPINYYSINSEIAPAIYSNTSPMYAYFIFNKIKIYRPYEDKTFKWRTNATCYDIQGYEQLPDKCEHIIITKSLKDVIVLTMLGYNAIAPNSENHTIPEVIIDKLRKDKGTTKFTIFYDNDEAGMKAAEKLLNKYEYFNNIFIGEECKDISDYVKEYGLNKAKEWMENNIT